MACVAVTYLMRTIELEFLQSNPRLMFQDRQHIKSLHEKLGLLLMFLEKKADYNEELNEVTAKIRDVAVKAEYDIEAELIHDETVDQTLRRVLEDVEQLMEMTKNAHHLAKDLQILHLESPSSVGQSPSQRTPNKLKDTIMVGHTEEFEEFKDQLLRSSNEQRQVMALVGIGGIGKTTFARRIYDESAVKSYFDCCGWATMSQDLNKRQVLLDLCRSVMPTSNDLNTQNDDELAEKLQKSLKGRRYLIVVDDIWSTKAWDNIQRCFPENNSSSRILLTTRVQEVASYACFSESFIYDMQFLNSDESWNLFCQKLVIKECLNKEFERIGRKIEHLVLRNCLELKEMPSWIEKLSNLKSVLLEHCHASLVTSAKKIEEEQRECYGEEYGFQILEFHTTQSEDLPEKDEDEKNSQSDEKSINDAEGIEGKQREYYGEENDEDIKMSVFLEARSLYIPHDNNPQRWSWTRDSSGHEVAVLLNVCWLEIKGKLDTRRLHKITSNSAYLIFKLKPEVRHLDTAFTSVRYIKDKSCYNENRRCQVFLAKKRSSEDPGRFPNHCHDGWMEIKLGDFYISSANEGEVEMRLWSNENVHWKFGLIVKGIEVRPN